MLLHDARRAARVDARGRYVALDEQDRSLLGPGAHRARACGRSSARVRLRRPGQYQLQAAITALHVQAPTPRRPTGRRSPSSTARSPSSTRRRWSSSTARPPSASPTGPRPASTLLEPLLARSGARALPAAARRPRRAAQARRRRGGRRARPTSGRSRSAPTPSSAPSSSGALHALLTRLSKSPLRLRRLVRPPRSPAATSTRRHAMTDFDMTTPPRVSAEEWQAARRALLVKEKEHDPRRGRAGGRAPADAVDGRWTRTTASTGRRAVSLARPVRRPPPADRLPRFYEPGVARLARSARCVGCSMVADQVAHPAHLHARDTSLAFVSRARRPTSRA